MNPIPYIAGAALGVLGIVLFKSKKSNKLITNGQANDVVTYFLDNGFTLNQSIGVAGNIQAESNFNSLASGDSGTAFGIAQWRGSRLENLKKYAADRNQNMNDFNVQLAFILYELKNYEKTALQKLKEADTLEAATFNFAKYYERPQSSTIPKRLDYSKEILKNYI